MPDPLAAQGISAVLHLAALGLLASLVPRMGPDAADAEEQADRVAFMLHALNASAEREHTALGVPAEDESPPPGQGGDGERGGGTGTRAPGEEGSPGRAVTVTRGGHVAVKGSRDEPDAHLARVAALRQAELFGLATGIGLTPVSSDPGAPTSPWGRETSRAVDAQSAVAALWGHTIEDAFAWGGLGLTGAGEGGGGRAEAIGLGDLGVFGRGAGVGTNMAFGPGDGMGGAGEGGGGRGEGIGIGGVGTLGHGGTHAVRAPRVCTCGGLSVNGRLPPEVIQRIVRANFGRFRMCYQRGLDRQPSLEGRVSTRFLVARSGEVIRAQDAGSDLPDSAVVGCVVAAFTMLSFPAPEGGMVSVEYPIRFSPE
jgi:hypothetical protein